MTDQPDDDGRSLLREVPWVEAELLGADAANDDDYFSPQDDADSGGDDAPPGESGFDVIRIPRSMRSRLTLPDNCPVVPLGVMEDRFFYLDRIGQLRRVSAEKHGQNTLKSLFGDTAYLIATWPRAKEDGEGGWVATGWKPEECGSALMDAAMRKGVFNPDKSVRGAGAWKGDDGQLIIHFGMDIGVWPADGSKPSWHVPCKMGDWIYPSRPPLPFPSKNSETATGAALEVLNYLRSWNWARPDVDPQLLLGWIVAAFLGASLKWHPLFWVVGDKGTGKSTLLLLVSSLLGQFMLSTANATAAYIYQSVGQDSRSVGIDEAEPDEESRRLQQQMELARAAASGVGLGRGGSDGVPVDFVQRAPYMFCSINMPGLNGADLSRIAVGVLSMLRDFTPPEGAKAPPEEDEAAMRKVMGPLGRRLLRRIVDGWHRLPAILKAYRAAMKEAGHSGRGADVFGTQLACAHMVLSDSMPTEAELRIWGERLKAADLAELSTDLASNRACLLHLMSSLLDVKQGGQSYTLGHWVGKGLENRLETEGEASGYSDVRKVLRTFGLDLRPDPKDKSSDAPRYLWVAYRHQGIARIFSDSTWKTRANTAGSWIRQLSSLPGAISNVSFFCDGVQDKAVLIPVHYCQENQDNMPPAEGQPGTVGNGNGGASAGLRSAGGAADSAISKPTDPFALDDLP